MTKPPSELISSNRPVRSEFARKRGIPYAVRRIITVVVLLSLLVGSGSWIWSNYFPSRPGEIPTVKAEGAYKQRPEQPGGIDIPNQDVQVYQEIDGSSKDGSEKPSVEHMLPPPEMPNASVTVPVTPLANLEDETKTESLIPAPAQTNAQLAIAPSVSESSPTPPVIQSPEPPSLAVAQPNTPPVQVVETEPKLVPIPKTEPPVVSKPVKTAPVSAGTTIIQLAATSDEAGAKSKTLELQNQFQTILGSVKLHIVRADLGVKGIFYRIQSQPMPESEASSICASIKKAQGGCILVHH